MLEHNSKQLNLSGIVSSELVNKKNKKGNTVGIFTLQVHKENLNTINIEIENFDLVISEKVIEECKEIIKIGNKVKVIGEIKPSNAGPFLLRLIVEKVELLKEWEFDWNIFPEEEEQII